MTGHTAPSKMLFFGSFLYITVLLINAVAVLSEDRFLARSTLASPPTRAIPSRPPGTQEPPVVRPS